MNGARFDHLARAMAAPTSRRGALRMLLGAVVAGIAAGAWRAAAQDMDAARIGGPFWRRGRPCDSDERCGSLAPCTNGICKPTKCQIDGVIYDPGDHPTNECLYCLPTNQPWTWSEWRVVPLVTSCEGGFEASGCRTDRGYCNSEGVCTPRPREDGELCGPGQTCCAGVCCTATQCCTSGIGCEECGPHCTIEGVVYPDTVPHPDPDGLCLVCDAAAELSFWSGAQNRTPCGPNRDRVCCSSTCCAPGECCGPDGRCAACEPACATDGAWCGPNNNQSCCDGECCDYGASCGLPGACACCPAGQRCNGGVCEPW